ncbi:MAG: hypothetical protein QOJ21_1938 [Solirubrobacteraceae bacterium]|nr:hypothetical protein [Solirubrobacteraceae bacterium]
MFPVRDFITANGYTPGQVVTVNVLRNGVIVGSAEATTGADGSVLVNHPANSGDVQNCWGNTTPGQATTAANRVPDISAGDVVQVLTGAGAGDEVVAQDVVVTSAAADVAGTVVVKGTAADLGGAALPAASVQQRLIKKNNAFDVNGRRDLRAPGDGTFTYPDASGPTHWTATYTGLSAADVTRAVNAESRMLWLGANPLLVNDLTLYEFGQIPGATAPCQGTLARTALTATDRTVVNAANVSSPLTVSGVADSLITGVSVSVPGGAAVAATLTAAPNGQKTWTAAIPSGDLAAQADGSFAVTASFTGAGAPRPDTATITKDTVAPPAPTATPAPGTYATPQSVTLADADGSAAIRYTNNGVAPTTSSPSAPAQISVTATQTLMALAVDPAGNTSAVASLSYVIGAVPGAAAAGTAAAVPPKAPTVLGAIASSKAPALVSRRAARRNGLVFRFAVPKGTRLMRVRVLRLGSKHATVVFRATYHARGSGQQVLRLNARRLRASLRTGSYKVEIRTFGRRRAIGHTITRLVRIS